MEIVTRLINDTIEFYKWTLTIAGKKQTKNVKCQKGTCWNLAKTKEKKKNSTNNQWKTVALVLMCMLGWCFTLQVNQSLHSHMAFWTYHTHTVTLLRQSLPHNAVTQISECRNGLWWTTPCPHWPSAPHTCCSFGWGPNTWRTESRSSSAKPSLFTTSAWSSSTSSSLKR